MNATDKFRADVLRIKKHDRADHADGYDGMRVCRAVADLFEKENRSVSSLAASIAGYWLATYIEPAANRAGADSGAGGMTGTAGGAAQEIPTEEHIHWLCDALDFLAGDTQNCGHFSAQDWTELRDMINTEAENLDLDLLTTLLDAVMEHGAL